MFSDSDANKLKGVVEDVEGWLTEHEATFLYNSARTAKRGEVVEIGSWKGRSTICLALGAEKIGKKVYAVDRHRGDESCGFENTLPAFKKNIKKFGVSDVVVPVVMKSEDAAVAWAKKRKPIGLLWIDASHDYMDVKNDFTMWIEYVSHGGVVALHDTFFRDGPKRVVDEFIFRGNFAYIGFVDEITYAIKVMNLTKTQKLLNLYKLLDRDFILARRKYSPKRVAEQSIKRFKLK